ncbi:UNVERIFIED_CONTAM: hypothetical protein GTU68_060974 [Idotea baltica]|nr:hypothetical protein [Idotea baltica]
MMDVGVHVGTLGAVILYFRRDVGRVAHALLQLILSKKEYDRTERHLMFALVISTIPIVIFGAIASRFGLTEFWRSIEVFAWTSIVFGILLYWFDTKYKSEYDLSALTIKNALVIGFAQVLAIVPGTSRSGITMTAARGLGFKRTDAARFSMLMSIPTIFGAALLQLKTLLEFQSVAIGFDLLLGVILSFFAALVAISGLLKWLQTSSMTPFVIYRILLGIGLLVMVYN